MWANALAIRSALRLGLRSSSRSGADLFGRDGMTALLAVIRQREVGMLIAPAFLVATPGHILAVLRLTLAAIGHECTVVRVPSRMAA